jgi:hypothetical protein
MAQATMRVPEQLRPLHYQQQPEAPGQAQEQWRMALVSRHHCNPVTDELPP